jgi:hypothetical protein
MSQHRNEQSKSDAEFLKSLTEGLNKWN